MQVTIKLLHETEDGKTVVVSSQHDSSEHIVERPEGIDCVFGTYKKFYPWHMIESVLTEETDDDNESSFPDEDDPMM